MKIHPTAVISDKATIGNNSTIGAFVIINDNVIIGDNCIIESYCELGVKTKLASGKSLIIGENALIRSHSVFYEGSTLGDNLVTGHRVTVREKTVAGVNFQIGTLSEIQGHCLIGNNVRTQSNVFISQHSEIGDFVWLFPYVVLTNDPRPPSNDLHGVKVEDFVVIAATSVILPGTIIARGCLVGAHSCLGGKTKEDTIYIGSPAKEIGPTSKLKLKDGTLRTAYPWRKHFTRGYPESIVNEWISEELSNI